MGDTVELNEAQLETSPPGTQAAPFPPPPPPPSGGVDIELNVSDVFCYAMSHRPLIRGVVVTNRGARSGDELTLSFTVESPGSEELLHAHAVAIPLPDVGDTAELRTVRLAPNPRALALLDEAVPANVVATASINGVVVGVSRSPVNILAYHQWMHRRETYDSYAAFVLPNHPAIVPIMAAARGLLQERTGSSSTQGYQALETDPERIVQIAGAVYDALQQQGYSYSNPPASFEGFGQKIRTPDVIVDEMCCTCLDSTVLFASCLAAAGLDPVLFLVTGHAFVGFETRKRDRSANHEWLGELLSQSVVTDPNGMVELVSSGAVVPVETTTITGDVGFSVARASAEEYFRTRTASLEGMVNVSRARAGGVPALPSRHRSDGVVQVVMPAEDRGRTESGSPSTPEMTPPAGEQDARLGEAFEAPGRVKAWLNALLDLSYSNPLLNLKDGRGAFRFELSAGQLANLEDRLMASERGVELLPGTAAPNTVFDADDLHEATARELERAGRIYWPSPAEAESAIEANKKELREQHPDAAPADVIQYAERLVIEVFTKELDKRVGAVKRKARELESQLGSNNLFVTIGALSWSDTGTSGRRGSANRVTAPLYLIPVRITGSGKTGFRIVTDQSAEVVPNYCLLEKMRRTFDLDLSALDEPVLDDAGIDVNRMLSSVRRAISEARVAGVTVEETAHLAVLSFAKFRLWKDLRDNWEAFMDNSVVRHLVETPYESYVDPKVDAIVADDGLLLPIEADESQREAIRWAVAGRSFVIEGPPGTGKSQTITNLLAAAIAANKKVLFVAEKQAALSVVKKRLERIGLEPFCIDLHDKGSKPDHIRQQLRQALDFTGEDRETEWTELAARHHADAEVLDSYRSALHTPNAAGYTVWSARQETIELGSGPTMPIAADFVHRQPHEILPVRDALLRLPQVATDRLIESSPWSISDRHDFQAIDQPGLARQLAALETLRSEIQRRTDTVALVAGTSGPLELLELANVIGSVSRLGTVPAEEVAQIGTADWVRRRDDLAAKIRSFVADQSAARDVFDDAVFRADLTQVMADGTEFATSGMLGRGKKERVFRVAIRPFLRGSVERPSSELFSMLQRVSVARTEQAELEASLKSIAGGGVLEANVLASPEWPDDLERKFEQLASDAQLASGDLAERVRESLAMDASSDGVAVVFERVGLAWRDLLMALGATEGSIARWRGDRHWTQAWAESEAEWNTDAPRFLGLQRWCEIVQTVLPLRTNGLHSAADSILCGDVPVEQAYDEYRRGVLQVAVAERRQAGRLDQFDGAAHDRRVKEFKDRDTRRRELMTTVIPHRLAGARPFEPGTRVGEYGALERELAKTTRRLSIRKLMERYGALLPNLTPCFLMSPDSVARFLPAGTAHFDLVVFDEASQIEVADSVGAMGRADAVVVVGDSRQMPPSKFGGSAATAGLDDDDSDELVFEDLESILSECVESNMPRLWLECHYRSRHESLITFSNHAFYEGRLVTFPSPDPDDSSAISWRRIDGLFHRTGTKDDLRTNPIEAGAIVAEIRRRLDDPAHAHQSICVVTLNIQQQSLITRLLEESGDERVRGLLDHEGEDSLIVRNLESVQGDERDVVMLSVAFSPPINDGVRGRLPLNFGPLNRQGGERRLNVAVTRAREEVVVFCSFDPEEMQLSTEPSRGLELLKQYLTIARGASAGSSDLSIRSPQARDLHRTDVADSLRAAGFRVRENLGLSRFRVDLALGAADGEDWPVAVLLDGPTWAERSTVVDRDVLPPAVLSMMGWSHVIRIWLPTWLDERARVVDQITSILNGELRLDDQGPEEVPADPTRNALPPPVFASPTTPPPPPIPSPTPPAQRTEAIPPPPPPPSVSMPASATASMASEPPSPDVTPVPSDLLVDDADDTLGDFAPAHTDVVGDREVLDRLDDPGAREAVAAQLVEVIDIEAPVQLERLARIVANRFGLSRVRQSRVDEILRLVPDDLCVETPFGVYAWRSEAQYQTWGDFRPTPPGVDRKLTEIAPEEIVNAFVAIVADAGVIERSELVGITATVFGMSRVTAQARTHLDAVLQWAIDQEEVAVSGDLLQLPLPPPD
jgi:very-short-patch-repair endonuclease